MPKRNTKMDSDKEVTSESDPFLLFKRYASKWRQSALTQMMLLKKLSAKTSLLIINPSFFWVKPAPILPQLAMEDAEL